MTVAVVIGLVSFGGLEDQDIPILAGLCFGGFFLGMFTTAGAASAGRRRRKIRRSCARRHVARLYRHYRFNHLQFHPGILHSISSDALPALQSLVIGNPFPFVLVTAFIALNGLFFHLMRAPT